MMYIDVHTHLTDEKFQPDLEEVIARASQAGLGAIVVNGIDPDSNRQTLELAKRWPIVRAALGIYPVSAVAHLSSKALPFDVVRFDSNLELEFIRSQAHAGHLWGLGECGLDGHWVGEETFGEQERIFETFIALALDTDLPLIVHTRKLEKRAGDILRTAGATKVIFHCFGGPMEMAQRYAEVDGWWFSIPANARRNKAFTRMLATLPADKILTETDAPYLPPDKGQRNEPCNVTRTIALLAELRGWSESQARQVVCDNFMKLGAN